VGRLEGILANQSYGAGRRNWRKLLRNLGHPSLYGVRTEKGTVMMNYCSEEVKTPVQVIRVNSSRQFALIPLLDGQ